VLEDGMLAFALLGAGWVLWLLVGLSVACIAVALERALYLARNRSDRAALAEAVNGFLSHGDRAALGQKLASMEGAEARILKAGLDVADHGAEAVEKAMAGTATAERMAMERGLLLLATVGSNAPFLGLFGTVLGIIQAFHDLSLSTDEAQGAVMAGISEALVATAVGLLVAIPAVVLFNVFSRAVKSRMGVSASLADLVLARIDAGPAGQAAAHGR
jgi:biopolymer transport protein ExbB